eukprot:2757432-Rhodomonas_salina.1
MATPWSPPLSTNNNGHPCSRLCNPARSVPTMELIQGMVRNRATIQIPDVGKFWPETAGSIRARVEGFRRFPGKRLGLQHEYYGFIWDRSQSHCTTFWFFNSPTSLQTWQRH